MRRTCGVTSGNETTASSGGGGSDIERGNMARGNGRGVRVEDHGEGARWCQVGEVMAKGVRTYTGQSYYENRARVLNAGILD